MRRAATVLAATLLVVAALVACRGREGEGPAGPASPREALDAIRSALAAGDGERLYALYDAEATAFHRQKVREMRARIALGEDPANLLEHYPITPAELARGTEVDDVELMLARGSVLARDAKWLATAAVVEERAEGDDAAVLHLRGADGTDRVLWFVRNASGWHYDHYRTSRALN